MSETILEGFFLAALWAPPLAVIACALLLLAPEPRARTRRIVPHHAPLPH